jgi:hypothetical protein
VWSGRVTGAPARATPLAADRTVSLLEDYRRGHPHATRALGRALGITELAGTMPLPADLADRLPVVCVAFGHRSFNPEMAALAELLAVRFTVFNYDRLGRGESGDTARGR